MLSIVATFSYRYLELDRFVFDTYIHCCTYIYRTHTHVRRLRLEVAIPELGDDKIPLYVAIPELGDDKIPLQVIYMRLA